MITPEILKNRIENFWGYGSLESPVWLVGMEEGFKSSGDKEIDMEMLEKQFSLPIVNGIFDASRPIAHEFSDLTNLSPFLPNSNIQPTWEFPITLYFILKYGEKPNNSKILDFQHNILADGTKKQVSTLELSPLPSPSTNSWLFSDIPEFASRKSLNNFLKKRSGKLRELVLHYSPKLVIFYSANKKTYLPRWAEVIGGMPAEIIKMMYFSQNNKTSFCVIPQFGYLKRLGWTDIKSYEYLYKYADKIKDVMNIL